jgi:hypothetical protein
LFCYGIIPLSASRFDRKSRERLLFIAAGFVCFAILAVLWAIPLVASTMTNGANSEWAVPAFWVLIAMHLVILALLIGNIRVSRKSARLRKTWLIIPGIILILMSIWLIDAAGAYMEHQPDLFSVATLLFICAFFDTMAGVITIILPARIKDNQSLQT